MTAFVGQVLSERERAAIQKVADKHYRYATCEALIAEVARIFEVSVEEIRGTSKSTRLTDARTVISFALLQRGISCKDIASHLNRDHSTISHHSRRAMKLIDLRVMAEALA